MARCQGHDYLLITTVHIHILSSKCFAIQMCQGRLLRIPLASQCGRPRRHGIKVQCWLFAAFRPVFAWGYSRSLPSKSFSLLLFIHVFNFLSRSVSIRLNDRACLRDPRPLRNHHHFIIQITVGMLNFLTHLPFYSTIRWPVAQCAAWFVIASQADSAFVLERIIDVLHDISECWIETLTAAMQMTAVIDVHGLLELGILIHKAAWILTAESMATIIVA